AAAYDFVLIDTPPLLAVTDAMVVAAEADEVLLTVRLARNGRSRAERAKEILVAAGARVLGVVINGVADRESWIVNRGVVDREPWIVNRNTNHDPRFPIRDSSNGTGQKGDE